ncbi:MAG: hypothetical protein JOY62_08260 [Acidobacteriaceae bacterium]|nr:hypothetical protein [Acidobacteriaceae bacterium]MBV9779954.1 hypothetical protein [Acidobacteriaceae bacterium]
MARIDVVKRLYHLKSNLSQLSDADKKFVSSLVELHESEQVLNRQQILRIIDMRVPGEEDTDESPILKFGAHETVSVFNANPEDVIWRYVPLEQLVAILWKRAIHFSPLSTMSDITEGQLPLRAWEETKKQLPKNVLDGHGCIDAETMMSCMVRQRRDDACISCWYMGPADCLKMWRDYAPSNGIAIQSTVQRLASCFRECQIPLTISPVKYFPPEEKEKYTGEAFWGSLFIKHANGFQHERELRALCVRPNVECGVNISVDLEIMIERLVLSPELKQWAVPGIFELTRRFGFVGPVEKSALKISDGEPAVSIR